MKIIRTEESRESCSEPELIAFDIFLDQPVDENLIKKLSVFGSLTYLSMLKEPFFKVEGDDIFIKGLQGDQLIRYAYTENSGEISSKERNFKNRIDYLKDFLEKM